MPDEAGDFSIVAQAFRKDGRGDYNISVEESENKIVHNIVRQGFPAAHADPKDLTKSDTAWEIDWTITDNNGRDSQVLEIRSAKFMYHDEKGKVRWITVAENLRMAEMFVPYDTTRPTYLDVGAFKFRLVPAREEYLGPNCVAPGEILQSEDKSMSNKVLKEVHDDGLRWLNGRGKARRGEKMMLWSMLSAGNYRYVMEFTFKDDGIIVCKAGATAHNLRNLMADRSDIHLHVGCWRCDMPLTDPTDPKADAGKNKVMLVTRHPNPKKPKGHFVISEKLFNPDDKGESREGWADWVAEEFTTLRVESTVRKNSNGKATAYDYLPLRFGAVRNYPQRHEFINHDFWVTRSEARFHTYSQVPQYVKEKRTLKDQPVTIWHNSPGIHVPRGEDFGPDGKSRNAGVALTFWVGFLMRPRNLFDSTPLYGKTPPRDATFLERLDKGKKNEHKVKLKKGVKYEITMRSSDFDTYLYLKNSKGDEVARNDDMGGGSLDSRINYTPQEDEEFVILAGSFGNKGNGEYAIWVKTKEEKEE